MANKLKLTGIEYQQWIRQQSKERTLKFRQEQEARGYKNLTIYLSEKFRSELIRLSKDHGLNRQSAMDHILNGYMDNVTRTQPTTEQISTEKPEFIDILESQAIEQPEIEVKKQAPGTPDLEQPITEAPDTGLATDTPVIDQSPVEAVAPDTEQIPDTPVQKDLEFKPDTPAPTTTEAVTKKTFNKDEICKVIVELKDGKGLGWTDISKELKAMGYRPKTKGKDTFHHSTVSNYYKDGKK